MAKKKTAMLGITFYSGNSLPFSPSSKSYWIKKKLIKNKKFQRQSFCFKGLQTKQTNKPPKGVGAGVINTYFVNHTKFGF